MSLTRTLLLAVLAVALPAAGLAQADLEALATSPVPGLGGYGAPFWPEGGYRDDVQSPSAYLGVDLGSRPATHAEMIRYFEYLDGFSTAELHDYGETYEGRRLIYLIVASEANAGRLDAIRADCLRLADPHTMGDADAKDVIARTPAVAWMAYGIHGDELSSGDAALQLAYQLVAGTDESTRRILDNCVVMIDPAENPDGRTRWLAQLAQWNGVIPSHDIQSLSHTGMWPYGRTNHYLFDLNRDWFAQVNPETRGRTRAILEWMPHYLLDCHEMGPLDTYLFSPPREPFNPNMPSYIHKWWERIAKEHAAQFDRFGWSHYSREWNEELYPGYGSSWPIYLGAIGVLFEQAGVDGSQVKRLDGTVMSYRETVHHQFVGSMANLIAVANGRAELLDDYYRQRVANTRAKPRTFVFAAGPNATRLNRFVERLESQNIEVRRTRKPLELARARRWDGTDARDVAIPPGSALVSTNQSNRLLIEAILEFDNRIPTDFLETERKEILARNDSRLYDATGWSLSLAYGLDAYRVDGIPRVETEAFAVTPRSGSLAGESASVGFAFDGCDDRAFELLARLFEDGVRVWCAKKPFRAGEVEFPAGSYFIRRNGNPDLDVARLVLLAEASGVDVIGVNDGFAGGRFANVGGNEFRLLKAPQVALVGGSGINAYNFGAVWHLLDSRLRMRATPIDIAGFAKADLSRYNVVYLPDAWSGTEFYKGALGEPGIKSLKAWVEAGGTVVGEGAGAAFLADTTVALSTTRLRRQVLKDWTEYEAALTAARAAMNPQVDSLSLWEGKAPAKPGADGEPAAAVGSEPDLEVLERQDELARKLAPRGVIVAIEVDTEEWTGFGCEKTIPALLMGDRAFVTKSVRVPARFAPAERMRLSGLLWEEARARWSETAYTTRDRLGDGQVILFACSPNFRGYYYGTERLLLNALFLGPGMGTAARLDW